jgi:hypothetical protein
LRFVQSLKPFFRNRTCFFGYIESSQRINGTWFGTLRRFNLGVKTEKMPIFAFQMAAFGVVAIF